jgi:hypothetical protein
MRCRNEKPAGSRFVPAGVLVEVALTTRFYMGSGEAAHSFDASQLKLSNPANDRLAAQMHFPQP